MHLYLVEVDVLGDTCVTVTAQGTSSTINVDTMIIPLITIYIRQTMLITVIQMMMVHGVTAKKINQRNQWLCVTVKVA